MDVVRTRSHNIGVKNDYTVAFRVVCEMVPLLRRTNRRRWATCLIRLRLKKNYLLYSMKSIHYTLSPHLAHTYWLVARRDSSWPLLVNRSVTSLADVEKNKWNRKSLPLLTYFISPPLQRCVYFYSNLYKCYVIITISGVNKTLYYNINIINYNKTVQTQHLFVWREFVGCVIIRYFAK